MITPIGITLAFIRLLLASTFNPFGNTPITGIITLAGIAKGIHHIGFIAQIAETPQLHIMLHMTEKPVFIFIDTNIHKGICHRNKINKSIDAIKLLTIEILLPKINPKIVILKKNIKDVKAKYIVHATILLYHNFFTSISTVNNP